MRILGSVRIILSMSYKSFGDTYEIRISSSFVDTGLSLARSGILETINGFLDGECGK